MAAPLLGANDMLAYLELSKLGQRVEQYRHANVFSLAHETEFGAFFGTVHVVYYGCAR